MISGRSSRCVAYPLTNLPALFALATNISVLKKYCVIQPKKALAGEFG
jgi:hypothetical protein